MKRRDTPADQLLARHPKPWKVEPGFSLSSPFEVHDADGVLVLECSTLAEAEGWCAQANRSST